MKKVEGSSDFTEKLSRCCNGVGDLWSSFHDIYFYFLRFHIFEVKQPPAKLIIETKNEMNIQTFSLKQNPLILIWQQDSFTVLPTTSLQHIQQSCFSCLFTISNIFVLQKYRMSDSEDHLLLFDLVMKMLAYDPDERLSLDDALRHPFFDSIPPHYRLDILRQNSSMKKKLSYEIKYL